MPRAPFVGWPEHYDRGRFYGWVSLEPRAIYTQTRASRAGAEDVHAMHDFLDELVELGFVQPGLLMFHDWRSITARDAGLREVWTTRADRPGRPFAGVGAVYICLDLSPVLGMTVQSAALGLQVLSGMPPVRIVKDLAVPLAEHRIARPPYRLPTQLARDAAAGPL